MINLCNVLPTSGFHFCNVILTCDLFVMSYCYLVFNFVMFYLYLGFVFVIFYRYISGLYPFTSVSIAVLVTNLKQNEAWSTPAESPHKGLNQRLEDVTQAQQQRPELPSVILTWHACKYKVHKLHQRYIL